MTYNLVTTDRFLKPQDWDLDEFFSFPFRFGRTNGALLPRVNIEEGKDDIRLALEMPGMEKEDIKVEVRDGVLTIKGERKESKESKDRTFVRREVTSGSFSRSFTLPDSVTADKIDADYRNGILQLTLPKREESKPREVEVKVR